MDEITGTDAIVAGRIISGYIVQNEKYLTKRKVSQLQSLAIRLNNYGVGRSD